MAEIESYLEKGFSNLTDAEETRLDKLTSAVEIWDSVEYPMPIQTGFRDILSHLMQSEGLNQSQLSTQLDVSDSLISGILKGKKFPNVGILLTIHKKFHIDGNLLLDSLRVS